LRLLNVGGLRLVEFTQGSFPTLVQFGRDQAGSGIDAAELSRRQGRLVPQPLEGVRVRVIHVPTGLVVFRHRAGIGSEFDR
jgi:hypothetical protein